MDLKNDMHKKIFQKIIKEKLTAEEKAEGLFVLKNFISTHPIEVDYEISTKKTAPTPFIPPIKSPFFVSFLSKENIFVHIGVAILVLSITGGTVLAANFSLPGDLLYPIKININEKVQTMIAIGTAAETDVKINHLNERLKEAENLSAKNRLDEKNKKEIELNLSKQAEIIEQRMTSLKDNGKEKESSEIKVKFTTSLEKHKEILLQLSIESEEIDASSASEIKENQKEENKAENKGKDKGKDKSNDEKDIIIPDTATSTSTKKDKENQKIPSVDIIEDDKK